MIDDPGGSAAGVSLMEMRGPDETRGADAVVSHLRKLLLTPRPPELPPELAGVDGLRELHDYLLVVRQSLANYAKGDFSAEIQQRGYVAGAMKSLQANIRHLLWSMERVEMGDMHQRVDFMGEFSMAFNKMVDQLLDALRALKEKEETLITLAAKLEKEVEKRDAALKALRESEKTFKYLAEHDSLTGIMNRRSFFTRAEIERARHSIMDQYVGIALMDVDRFKLFNDTHGHLEGDKALRHVAALAQETLRDSDFMGRYGGEEFIFFFPGAEVEQASIGAERIRKRIAANPVRLGNGVEVEVTASFGLTSIPPGLAVSSDFNLLKYAISLADSALYKAKAGGRNQVRAAEFPQRLPISRYDD